MFCPNCGKQLEDRAKFCTNCGTSLTAPMGAAAAPVQPAPASKPVKAKKKKTNTMKKILPIAAVALLVVVALVICIVAGIFGSDKAKLASAIGKSALAYQEASENIPLPAIIEKGEKAAFSQAVNVKIDDLPAMPDLEGFGVQFALDSNLAKREIAMTATPTFGSASILDAQVLIRNNEVYLVLPQLLDDRSYVVNTETIGASLVNQDMVDEELEAFGFNIFDLVEILEENTKIDEDVKKDLEKAFKQFAKAIDVDKTGKEKIEVNDHNLKCDAYKVIITEDSLLDLLDAFESVSRKTDPTKMVIAILESIGAPDYVIDDVKYEMEDVGSVRDAFETLEDAIKELDDIELEMFLHKGYVVAVRYEVSIDDVDLEIVLNLGGGDNYVDDLRLEILADDGKVVVESNGNHTGAKGVYTDTTTLKIHSDYSDTITLSSELYYEPKASDENFSWTLDADALQIDLAGQVVTSKKELSAQLEEVNVWVDGEYIIGIGLDVQIGQYAPASVNTGNAVALLDLSEDELNAEVEYMEQAALSWAMGLVDSNPELIGMLQGMMF